jgi:hypothetical protein
LEVLMDFDDDSFKVACRILQPPLGLLADMGVDRRAIIVCLVQAVGVITINTKIDTGEVLRELQETFNRVFEEGETRRKTDGTQD